jgi:hypothetical protein
LIGLEERNHFILAVRHYPAEPKEPDLESVAQMI